LPALDRAGCISIQGDVTCEAHSFDVYILYVNNMITQVDMNVKGKIICPLYQLFNNLYTPVSTRHAPFIV
jgi:hypothetical protein